MRACGMAETTVIVLETCNWTSASVEKETETYCRGVFFSSVCHSRVGVLFLCAPPLPPIPSSSSSPEPETLGWGLGDEWLPPGRDALRCLTSALPEQRVQRETVVNMTGSRAGVRRRAVTVGGWLLYKKASKTWAEL